MAKAPVSAQILSSSKLAATLKKLKKSGHRIVFTNGCFDILHVGHVRYLAQARALGDLLVVGLNTNVSVRRLKGPNRPVNDEKSRALVLGALRSVDFVTFFGEPTPLELIKALVPDVLVKGGDWKKKDIVGSDFVESRGGSVRSLKFVDGFSTTRTIEKLSRK
jgi:D-beta-D-heptose 7-phosphate kinase/D-beta-D-heptose 1-phosphate adenosyltransferase